MRKQALGSSVSAYIAAAPKPAQPMLRELRRRNRKNSSPTR